MDHLTRGPRILRGRPPTWRTRLRRRLPLPGATAWLLALGIILVAGLIQALLRSAS